MVRVRVRGCGKAERGRGTAVSITTICLTDSSNSRHRPETEIMERLSVARRRELQLSQEEGAWRHPGPDQQRVQGQCLRAVQEARLFHPLHLHRGCAQIVVTWAPKSIYINYY